MRLGCCCASYSQEAASFRVRSYHSQDGVYTIHVDRPSTSGLRYLRFASEDWQHQARIKAWPLTFCQVAKLNSSFSEVEPLRLEQVDDLSGSNHPHSSVFYGFSCQNTDYGNLQTYTDLLTEQTMIVLTAQIATTCSRHWLDRVVLSVSIDIYS